MRDRELKIHCLEAIDRHIVGPIIEHFRPRMDELGGIMVAPDHYTNLLLDGTRVHAHSLHPVPFALWNGRDRDQALSFDENAAASGLWGARPIGHLDLLPVLGVTRRIEPPGTTPWSLSHPPLPMKRLADRAAALGSIPLDQAR